MSKINKILDLKSLRIIRNRFKKKKIVLCHGVFDLLHVGHINYFKAARNLGDTLVVSLTDDKYVNKGPGRPAFSINNRIKFLKEINCIDHVYISASDTAENVIINLKPHFYCKGSEYTFKGAQFDRNLKKEIRALKSIKGKFKTINQPSYSSSKFINDNDFQNLNSDGKFFLETIRKEYGLKKVQDSINKIEKKKVLIVGETIIDKYITTESVGKSGKEPMLVVKPKKEINFLGGSSYIANLCSSFAKKVKIISFLGKEKTEKKFILSNLNKKIEHNFFLKSNSPTIKKLRYVDYYRNTKIIGVYDLNDDPISKVEENKFYTTLKNNIKKYDLIIVADYGHGIITKRIRKLILKNGKKVFLNTQINSFNRGFHTVFNYKKINTLIINESELRYELRDKNSNVVNLVKKLRKNISADNIIVTRGKEGAVIINSKKNQVLMCPAFNQSNKDTIGAGDTFFGICSLALSAKVEPKISLLLASIGANFSIDQIGKKDIFDLSSLKKYISHVLK